MPGKMGEEITGIQSMIDRIQDSVDCTVDSNWQEVALHFSTFYLVVFAILTFNFTDLPTTSLGSAFLRLIISFCIPLDDGTVFSFS